MQPWTLTASPQPLVVSIKTAAAAAMFEGDHSQSHEYNRYPDRPDDHPDDRAPDDHVDDRMSYPVDDRLVD